MGCKLEDTVKYEVSPLEKDIAPVPSVIFHDIMRFSFHPEVECDQ